MLLFCFEWSVNVLLLLVKNFPTDRCDSNLDSCIFTVTAPPKVKSLVNKFESTKENYFCCVLPNLKLCLHFTNLSVLIDSNIINRSFADKEVSTTNVRKACLLKSIGCKRLSYLQHILTLYDAINKRKQITCFAQLPPFTTFVFIVVVSTKLIIIT